MKTSQVTTKGITLNVRKGCEHDMFIVEEVLSRNTYQIEETFCSRFEIQTILDVGAHIGVTTLLMNRLFPNARIISFEPNEESFELLCMNTAHLDQITPVNSAIWYPQKKNASLCLIKKIDFGLGGAQVANENWIQWENVHVVQEKIEYETLEDAIARFPSGSVDLIKWDCEGGEVNAFHHMEKTTVDCIGHMFGEYHGFLETFEDVLTTRFPMSRWMSLIIPYEQVRTIGRFWVLDQKPENKRDFMRLIQ